MPLVHILERYSKDHELSQQCYSSMKRSRCNCMIKNEHTAFDLRGLALVVATVAWVAGILLGNIMPLSSLPLLIAACAAFLCLLFFWRNPRHRIFTLIILCFL